MPGNYDIGRATAMAASLYTFAPMKWIQTIPIFSWLNEGMLFTTISPLSVLYGGILMDSLPHERENVDDCLNSDKKNSNQQ